MRAIVLSGLAALALLTCAVVPASAAPAAPRALAAPGAITATAIEISKISCGSPAFCLAIGADFNLTAQNVSSVALGWNGRAWRILAVPAIKGVSEVALTGVSCKAGGCVAVGQDISDTVSGGLGMFAVTWNGRGTLRLTPVPPAPSGVISVGLNAVSCVTARYCVAVGSVLNNGTTTSPMLVETWDGARWAARQVPLPAGADLVLFGDVSCVAVARCVAVGNSYGAAAIPDAFIATWNGKSFTPATVRVPAGIKIPELVAVSCSAATSCAATGFDDAGLTAGKGLAFTEVLAGKTWTTGRMRWPKGTSSSLLLGVSCSTARFCVATGSTGSGKAARAVALAYNGRSWSPQSFPAPARGNSDGLGGVSCLTAKDCVAIGETGPATSSSLSTLAAFWNGKNWRVTRLRPPA